MESTPNEVQRDDKTTKKVEKSVSSSPSNKQVGKKGGDEVNIEASIMEDDVVRAGGFGARDDIGSFLPVASDSTDFEATIRDAREYEEPQVDVQRRGLGWEAPSETK